MRVAVQQWANTFCLTDKRASGRIKHMIPSKSMLRLRCHWTDTSRVTSIRGTPPIDRSPFYSKSKQNLQRQRAWAHCQLLRKVACLEHQLWLPRNCGKLNLCSTFYWKRGSHHFYFNLEKPEMSFIKQYFLSPHNYFLGSSAMF